MLCRKLNLGARAHDKIAVRAAWISLQCLPKSLMRAPIILSVACRSEFFKKIPNVLRWRSAVLYALLRENSRRVRRLERCGSGRSSELELKYLLLVID